MLIAYCKLLWNIARPARGRPRHPRRNNDNTNDDNNNDNHNDNNNDIDNNNDNNDDNNNDNNSNNDANSHSDANHDITTSNNNADNDNPLPPRRGRAVLAELLRGPGAAQASKDANLSQRHFLWSLAY